jgi:hypothetical protein
MLAPMEVPPFFPCPESRNVLRRGLRAFVIVVSYEVRYCVIARRVSRA